ncbi:hypothetical protein VPHD479_0392 [Vibrio phage D479]
MNDFKQFMVEALDLAKAAPIQWKNDNDANFRVGSTQYVIEFAGFGGYTEVAYGSVNERGRMNVSANNVTGSPSETLKVITSVLKAVKEYIDRKSPTKIFFTAYEHDDKRDSRKKLYDRLVKRFAEDAGYTFTIDRNKYTLVRAQRKDAEWTEEEVQLAIDNSNDLMFPFEVREFRWLKPGKEMVILGMSQDGFDVVVISGVVRGTSKRHIILDQDDSYVTDDIDDAYATFEEW